MKLPRNVSGQELVRALQRIGYVPVRQTGAHVRMTKTSHGERHTTVPMHQSIKVGTLADILAEVAENEGMDRDQLLQLLDL